MLRMFVLCLFITGCSSASIPRDDTDEADAGDTFDSEEVSDSDDSETFDSETSGSETFESDSPSDTYTKNWSCVICENPPSLR